MEEPILLVDRVVKRFGGVTAVNGVSLSLEAGRIYGLIGPNGSGKTTLFNCITGVEQSDGGQIRFKGQRIDGLKPHQVFHQALDAWGNHELVRGMAQVMQEVTIKKRLALLLQPHHRIKLGRGLVRQQAAHELDVRRRRLHVDQKIRARERKQGRDPVRGGVDESVLRTCQGVCRFG